jgi:protocatechuate 3,4-dioxygenase beta subunit
MENQSVYFRDYGDAGIGTTSPAARLHVSSATAPSRSSFAQRRRRSAASARGWTARSVRLQRVGKMMVTLGRQVYRPAHIHFILSAKGYETLTTHIFVAGDPHLDSDPVFAMKKSLVVDFVRHDSPEEARARGTTAPFYTVEYDFVLKPAA